MDKLIKVSVRIVRPQFRWPVVLCLAMALFSITLHLPSLGLLDFFSANSNSGGTDLMESHEDTSDVMDDDSALPACTSTAWLQPVVSLVSDPGLPRSMWRCAPPVHPPSALD